MNSWIQYVKQFAKKNNMSYSKALKHPDCSKSYKNKIGTGAGQSRVMPDGTGAGQNRVTPYEPRNRYEQIDIQVEDYIQTIQILDREINELNEMMNGYRQYNNDPMTYRFYNPQSDIIELRRITEAAINSRNNYINAVNRLRQEQSTLTPPTGRSVSSINFDDI